MIAITVAVGMYWVRRVISSTSGSCDNYIHWHLSSLIVSAESGFCCSCSPAISLRASGQCPTQISLWTVMVVVLVVVVVEVVEVGLSWWW